MIQNMTQRLRRQGTTDIAVFAMAELLLGYPETRVPPFDNSFWWAGLESWLGNDL